MCFRSETNYIAYTYLSFFKISTARFLAYQNDGKIPTTISNSNKKIVIIMKSETVAISLKFTFLLVISLKR